MKTTHELARELLALPDVQILVEGWLMGHAPKATMSDYDPETTAFLVPEVTFPELEKKP